MRLSFYGTPVFDGATTTYALGIGSSMLWTMAGGGQFQVYTSNGGTPVPMLNLNQGTLSLYVGGPGSALTPGIGIMQFRADNSVVDPGMPWTRSDGHFLVINPSGTGMMFLCWDKANQLNVGGALVVTGATTLNSTLAITGASTFSSTLAVTGLGDFGVSTAGWFTGANIKSNAALTVAGATTLNGVVNTGSSPLTVGLGGFASNGAAQFNSTLNVSGLVSIQGITTNSTVTHQSVGRLTLSGATMFGPTGTGNYGTGPGSYMSLGVTINGVNYWINLST